ncbi:TonB-dependent receptor [Achromobacter sp. GG226]|nr:TonB-dependent receptor [Verticiella sp. GG226]
MLSVGTAHAQAAPAVTPSSSHRYDIPAGPLNVVLARVAAVSGVLLAAAPAQVEGRSSPGVQGTFAPAAALDRALAGTGLSARADAWGQFRLIEGSGAAVARLSAITVIGTGSATGLPPAYAGGQVAQGGRLGMLGDRDNLDTAFSVTQYTAQRIEETQAQAIGDILMDDPSVRNTYARGAGRDEFNIRGFQLYNYDVSFNGLYGITPRNASSLIGVERVEVLRGPSALLNGMAPYGSLGGAINLVPKRAGPTPLNRLTLSYIGKSQVGAHADIGRRFGENQAWGVRVNALGQNGDMVVKGGRERLGALALGVDYQGERARMAVDVNYQDRVTHARSGLLLTPESGIGIPPAPDARHTFFPDWTYWDAKDASGTVRGEFDLTPDWTLYAAAGTRRHDFKSLQTTFLMLDDAGGIGTNPSALNESLTSVTGEVGLRGRFRTGPLQHEPVLSVSGLGVDYHARRVRTTTVFSDLYDPVAIARPDIRISGPLPLATENRLRSVALADTISFADGRVQLTAGLRHQHVEVSSFDAASGDRTSRYAESAVTPAVALVLRPTDRLSFYGNFIQGLNQGATAPSTATNAGEVFPPEVSRQREVGIKYDAGRVAATLSAFEITRPSSYLQPSSLRFVVDGRQRNRGLELLVQGEPLPGVRLLGGAAYTDARLVRTAGGLNDGNQAPAVSRLQFNASAEWDTPFLEGLTLTARVLRTGRQYVDVANTQSIPGWTRVDIGARYAFDAGGTPMVVRATIENVLNKTYWQSAAREGLTVGAPITALLSVSAEF